MRVRAIRLTMVALLVHGRTDSWCTPDRIVSRFKATRPLRMMPGLMQDTKKALATRSGLPLRRPQKGPDPGATVASPAVVNTVEKVTTVSPATAQASSEPVSAISFVIERDSRRLAPPLVPFSTSHYMPQLTRPLPPQNSLSLVSNPPLTKPCLGPNSMRRPLPPPPPPHRIDDGLVSFGPYLTQTGGKDRAAWSFPA